MSRWVPADSPGGVRCDAPAAGDDFVLVRIGEAVHTGLPDKAAGGAVPATGDERHVGVGWPAEWAGSSAAAWLSSS